MNDWISMHAPPPIGLKVDIWRPQDGRMADYVMVVAGVFEPVECGVSPVCDATHWRAIPDGPNGENSVLYFDL